MFSIRKYALSFLLFGAIAGAQPGTLRVVSTTDLGTLGGNFSRATGINNAGQVVGVSSTATGEQHAFLWTARTGMVDLGVLPPGLRPPYSAADGINNLGQIVGESNCGINCGHAVIWDPAGNMSDRGSLGSGGNEAYAINDVGQFGGIATVPPYCRVCANWAFIAPVGGGDFRYLGALYTGANSAVRGLNNLGQAAGTSEIDADITFQTHAFFWSDRSGMIDLGTLGGPQSEGRGINNNSQVVGWAEWGRGGGIQHAFRWQAGAGMTDLGGLEPFYLSEAHAINDSGLIAGWSSIGNTHHAVVWQPGGAIRDLGTTENGGFSQAHALNVNLQVAGEAVTVTGETHAILWTLAENHENHPPTAVCGSPRSGGMSFGSEGSPAVLDAQASSDPDGDLLDFQWYFGDGTSAHTGHIGVVDHTYADNATYVAQVTVTDPAGLSSTATCTVQIANVAPSFPCLDRGCATQIPGGTILQGEPFAAPGSFLDPGADTWTAAVNYGDGTGLMSLPLSGKNFALSHRYRIPGTFTIAVAVTDDDGGVGTAQGQVVVKSWQQALGEVSAAVPALGIPNNGEVNALLQKLAAAIAQLNAGQVIPAGNQLGAFLNQLTALVQSGQVPAATAQPLIDAVNRILAAMQP